MDYADKRGRLPEELTEDQVQELVEQLPGVESCRLVCNDWGAIEEFHVLAADERHPKQTVRDIESALAARWGLHIDHKRISVARLSPGADDLGLSAGDVGNAWIELVSIRSTSHPARQFLEVEVTLRTSDAEVTGRAEGGVARAQYGRLTAEAATRAANEILPPGNYMQMEDIRAVDMAAGPAVCIQHSLLRPRRGSRLMVGAAPVPDDDWSQAAVQSIITALNSHVQHLFTGDSGE